MDTEKRDGLAHRVFLESVLLRPVKLLRPKGFDLE